MRTGADRAATERRSAERENSATVLIVDDSRAVRRILRRGLEEAGYRVEEAADGGEGVAACRTVRPDLVLLDVDMPVMDGIEALTVMRADEGLCSIPVLFLTARTGGNDVAHGLELGAQDYLRKPCEPAELLARVAAALRASERQHALARRAQQADEASSRDALTGVHNRRFLEARRRELIAGAGPDLPAGVLVVDADHFKRINDEHGHPVGDDVLRILAQRLAGTLGEGPVLVRWGGEEFVVLAPDISRSELVSLGERLRASVGGTPFSIGVDKRLAVTVSVGAAVGPLGSFDSMVEAADEALYAAKRAGRNRLSVSSR